MSAAVTKRDPRENPSAGDVLEIGSTRRKVVTTHDDTVVFLNGTGVVEHFWGLETWRDWARSAAVLELGDPA